MTMVNQGIESRVLYVICINVIVLGKTDDKYIFK